MLYYQTYLLLIRNFVIPARLVTMLLVFYEYGNMRVHLCYKCYYMRRKEMKFDSDSLQDKLNHKIFYAKRVLPDNIYMLINISFTNMAYGQYQILKILLYILHPESSFQRCNLAAANRFQSILFDIV